MMGKTQAGQDGRADRRTQHTKQGGNHAAAGQTTHAPDTPTPRPQHRHGENTAAAVNHNHENTATANAPNNNTATFNAIRNAANANTDTQTANANADLNANSENNGVIYFKEVKRKMPKAPTIRIRGISEEGKKQIQLINLLKEGVDLVGGSTANIDAGFVSEYKAKLENSLGKQKEAIFNAVASQKELEAKELQDQANLLRQELAGKKA